MKAFRSTLFAAALSFMFAGALAQAATITGTVTDQTTNKPAAGDTVELVDVQANMAVVAHATTNAQGHYSLTEPGSGPYLIRVTHQGAPYFIAAPQNGGPGDIPVYDVKSKVEGVHIEADVLEIEAANGKLNVDERYFVHNTSSPPVTQWSPQSFEIVLPADATIVDTGAQRPSGLPTSVHLNPVGAKGHYAFNFPIQPDEGGKDTLFQVAYTLPYSSSSFTFHAQLTVPADDLGVLLPKSMTFKAGANTGFSPIQEDPGVQTFLVRNPPVGKSIAFTVSGEGSMPRQQGSSEQPSAASGNGGQPGGGLGTPIGTPDPLSKYKWWILGGLALLLTIAAAFLLRRPAGQTAPVSGDAAAAGSLPVPTTHAAPGAPAARSSALLSALKDELFAVESEKIAGKLPEKEYAEVKAALETVLKRALKKG
jgi:Carboxypeptidase regulatory-like domain